MDKSPADVLEEAADLLLIHGRTQATGRNLQGQFCVLGAIAEVVTPGWYDVDSAAYFSAVSLSTDPGYPAVDALAARLPARLEQPGSWNVYEWNDGIEDDFEVIDTLRLVAKDLRNEAAS